MCRFTGHLLVDKPACLCVKVDRLHAEGILWLLDERHEFIKHCQVAKAQHHASQRDPSKILEDFGHFWVVFVHFLADQVLDEEWMKQELCSCACQWSVCEGVACWAVFLQMIVDANPSSHRKSFVKYCGFEERLVGRKEVDHSELSYGCRFLFVNFKHRVHQV